eukprot:403366933
MQKHPANSKQSSDIGFINDHQIDNNFPRFRNNPVVYDVGDDLRRLQQQQNKQHIVDSDSPIRAYLENDNSDTQYQQINYEENANIPTNYQQNVTTLRSQTMVYQQNDSRIQEKHLDSIMKSAQTLESSHKKQLQNEHQQKPAQIQQLDDNPFEVAQNSQESLSVYQKYSNSLNYQQYGQNEQYRGLLNQKQNPMLYQLPQQLTGSDQKNPNVLEKQAEGLSAANYQNQSMHNKQNNLNQNQLKQQLNSYPSNLQPLSTQQNNLRLHQQQQPQFQHQDLVSVLIEESNQKKQQRLRQQELEIQVLEDEQNKKIYKLAQIEMKINMQRLNLDYNKQRNYKLRATVVFCFVFLIVVVGLGYNKKEKGTKWFGNQSAENILRQQGGSSKRDIDTIIQEKVDIINAININLNASNASHQQSQVPIIEQPVQKDIKILDLHELLINTQSVSIQNQQTKGSLIYQPRFTMKIIEEQIDSLMKQLFHHNRTLLQDFNNYQNEKLVPKSQIDHYFLSSPQTQTSTRLLKQEQILFTQYYLGLLDTHKTLQPLLQKLLSSQYYQGQNQQQNKQINTQVYYYIREILDDLEFDVQQCKHKLTSLLQDYVKLRVASEQLGSDFTQELLTGNSPRFITLKILNENIVDENQLPSISQVLQIWNKKNSLQIQRTNLNEEQLQRQETIRVRLLFDKIIETQCFVQFKQNTHKLWKQLNNQAK